MRKVVFIFILLSSALFSQAQEKFTFNGYIKDSLSGETLIGATLFVKEQGKGVTSNQYGFFSITLTKGKYNFVCNSVGYNTKEIYVDLLSNKEITILLSPYKSTLQDVVVTTRKKDNNVRAAQMGKIDINVANAKSLPAFLGEVDLLKTLQLLPGVKNAGEGNSGFFVRGGNADQNLILLDDAVVFNPGHLFGFFSVINADAIKNVSLIKGGMPAQYGGRLSSVVDIAMKEGNLNKTEVDAGIGLIASRFSIQGPIKKNKASFLLAARRTYVDVLTKPFISKSNSFYGSGYYFYDLNAKVNYKIGDKDHLYLSGYFGRDKFDFKNAERSFSTSIPWGNATATLRWNHVFNKKLFANTTIVYNDYNFEFNGNQSNFNIKLSSGIRDLNAKTDYDWFVTPEHKLKFGAAYTYHTFFPSALTGNQDSVVFTPDNTKTKYANEYAAYVQDDWEIGKRIKINYGLRYSVFQQIGSYTKYVRDADGNKLDSTVYGKGKTVKVYSGIEPRFTFRYAINDNESVKAAVTQNYQYIHLVSNNGNTLPTDLWVPSTAVIKPQIAWQYAVGYFKNFNKGMYETSVEAYYKTMENQIEYRQGYTPNTLKDVEEDFVFGKGWSYGTELYINKAKGRLTGWLSYTLSWTKRKFADINNGEEYYAKFDRRHDLAITTTYNLSSKWKLGAVFVYSTGNATTIPEKFYFVNGVLTQEYSKINAYRLPAYHRLDFAATYTPTPKKKHKYTSNWVFSIYNVYNRKNPYFIYFDQTGSLAGGDLKIQGKQVSLFPILPSVTWNVKW
ncbi:MAG: TonB-dependent receptor [Bacteroidetes bacterium]|nr:TonB-dependent receptor [Bacteroidota bacterium]